jgi:hypothetical protein
MKTAFPGSLSLDATVTVDENLVSTRLAGETVILHLTSGVYYGLDEIGTHIWELLQQPVTISDLFDQLLQGYAVEREQCLSDLLNFLQELMEHKLVKTHDGVV